MIVFGEQVVKCPFCDELYVVYSYYVGTGSDIYGPILA